MSHQRHNFTVPPGYHPPFAIVTDNDHSGWIIITTALGLSLTLLFAGIRTFVRVVISQEFRLDDMFVYVATAAAVTQSSVILGACSVGLGKTTSLIPHDTRIKVQQLYYAGDLLFILALGLSKASVAVFLLRIAPFNPQRGAVKILLGLIFTWIVVGLFIQAFRCDVSEPWVIIGSDCTGLLLRNQILEAVASTFEVAMVAVALSLVWGLSTFKREDKTTVVVMFCFRLPVILFAVLRLLNFDGQGFTTDPTLLEAPFVTWTQTELSYSIIAATILILRPFICDLTTHYGQGRSKSHDETFQMCLLSDAQSRRATEATLQPPSESRTNSIPSNVALIAVVNERV